MTRERLREIVPEADVSRGIPGGVADMTNGHRLFAVNDRTLTAEQLRTLLAEGLLVLEAGDYRLALEFAP